MKTFARAAALVALLAMAGCGKQGILERPAPLFGSRAQAQYEAEKADAAASAAAAARRDGQEVDNSNNGPRSTSEVRDPAQVLSTPRSAPVVGAPSGPGGAPPSLSPPN